MPNNTENHEYKKPVPWDQGTEDEDVWGDQLNDNLDQLDDEVAIRDTESNLGSYTPNSSAVFVATDTGKVYEGDGSAWIPATRVFGSLVDYGEGFDNVVYYDSDADDWVTKFLGNTTRHGNPTDALLQATTNGGSIHLADNVHSGEAISETITIGSDFKGPGIRGSGVIYASSGADPVFEFDGNTSGLYISNFWIRGQNNNIDGAHFIDIGRGGVIQDVQFSRMDGNGMSVQGCQQMTIRNPTFGRVGHPSNDTGELRLTDSPNQDLESNAINIISYHSHGGNNPQGTSIMMRADHTTNDRPRNIHVNHVNLENGPSSDIPIFELCGRDNWFRDIRAMGIDDASTVFQMQGPRATGMHIRDVIAIGADHVVSNDASTAASSQSAIDDMPTISGLDADTTAHAILGGGYNQTDDGLSISDSIFHGDVVDVTASKDVTPAVRLSNLECKGGDVKVQGARLFVSNVDDATWYQSFNDEFGPHIAGDDGSFTPAHGVTSFTNSSGVASVDFRGTCQFPLDGSIDVEIVTDSLGNGPYSIETGFSDVSGDGTADHVTATVYWADFANDQWQTVGSDDVEVKFHVYATQ